MNDKMLEDAEVMELGWGGEQTLGRPGRRASSGNKRLFFAGKRLFDVLSSLIGLVVLSPVFLLVAAAIRLESKGGAIFAHKRVGKGGVPFPLYKFRSMVSGAEAMLEGFTPEQKKEFEENYKLDKDPRITRVGAFLRRTSLDELPQLVNILRGDISLVGPRPLVESELEAKYGNLKGLFLSVKPGLTGYWQVHGRSMTTYAQRRAMELYYVKNASFWLDVKILLRTVVVVLRKVGAK